MCVLERVNECASLRLFSLQCITYNSSLFPSSIYPNAAPDFPADIFTACLTTPIRMALKWFTANSVLTHIDPEIIERVGLRLRCCGEVRLRGGCVCVFVCVCVCVFSCCCQPLSFPFCTRHVRRILGASVRLTLSSFYTSIDSGTAD